MSIISYAQNFEDVMLWRALGHIQHGLYVDIGAQHPLVDSVSMAFHQAGWQGVHIEPVQAYAEMLRQARPGDTVLQVALGATEGILDLHVIDDSGLSTAVGAYAQQHTSHSGTSVRTEQVPMLTLTSALRHLAGRDLHWMKIDVEGFEDQVLRGWDSKLLRPWILVVEATKPGSPETDFTSWDPLVTAAGYRFVYFDGLNRFYVADEHATLAAAFAAPPNVFDGAQLNGTASAPWCHRVLTQASEARSAADAQTLWLRNEWEAASAHARATEASLTTQIAARHALEQALNDEQRRMQRLLAEQSKDLLEKHNAEIAALSAQWTAAKTAMEVRIADLGHWSHHWYTIAEEREQGRMQLLHSKSWRATAPLRRGASLLGRGLGFARHLPRRLRNQATASAKRGVRSLVRLVLGNSHLSELARRLLISHPALKATLRRISASADFSRQAPVIDAGAAPGPAQLHERARALYMEMRKVASIKEI